MTHTNHCFGSISQDRLLDRATFHAHIHIVAPSHFPTSSTQTSSTKIELGLDNVEFTSIANQQGVNGLVSTHCLKYTLITYLLKILYSQVTLNRHGYQIQVTNVVSTPCKRVKQFDIQCDRPLGRGHNLFMKRHSITSASPKDQSFSSSS